MAAQKHSSFKIYLKAFSLQKRLQKRGIRHQALRYDELQ
jgi:hypothetical protein